VKNAIARLRSPVGTGTAWLCASELALTAAHCVEARQVPPAPDVGLGKPMAPSDLTLEFPWERDNVVKVVEVVGFDRGIDAALLRLEAGRVPLGVEPLTIAALPTGLTEKDGTRWSAYGFPRAHGEGLTLTGSITDPDGKVGRFPAIQLLCEQGGLGELNGSSGSAVRYGDRAVGLIRYGTLAQRVIFAVPIDAIAAAFPQLRLQLGNIPPAALTKHSELAPEAVAIYIKRRAYLQKALATTANASQEFHLLQKIADIDQVLQGAGDITDALTVWREKLAFLQKRLAEGPDADQEFALKMQIAECKSKIAEFGG
jgi:hypothetical protein